MLTFTDNFDRTSTDDLGGDWTALQGTLSGWGCNGSVATRTGVDSRNSVYFNKSLAAKSYTEVKLVANVAVSAVMARAQISGTTKFYMAYANGTGAGSQIYLFYFDGTNYNSLGTPQTVNWASNDTIGIDCSGSTVAGYRNGSSVFSVTDTNLMSGYSGIWRDKTSSGASGTAQYDNFKFMNYDPPVLKPLVASQAVTRAATR